MAHRGDYGKIPCIMGDYDTGIRGPLNPREWFAASDGHLYFVKADGVTVIDIYDKILEGHIKDGYHNTFNFKNGIHLKISQQVGQTSNDLCTPIVITRPKNGDKDWDLHINKRLSLGIEKDGVVVSDVNGTTDVVNPLPLNKGGTNNNAWGPITTYGGYLTIYDGYQLRSSPYYVGGINYPTYNDSAIAPSNWVLGLYNDLLNKINNLNNKLSNYATKRDLDALKRRVEALEEEVAALRAKNIPSFVVLDDNNNVDSSNSISCISVGGKSTYVVSCFHLANTITRHQAEGPSGETRKSNCWGNWCDAQFVQGDDKFFPSIPSHSRG